MSGFYDSTDDYPGYRIAYIALSENIMDAMRSSFCAIIGVAMLCFADVQQAVVASGFVAGAVISFLILFQRFPTLKKL